MTFYPNHLYKTCNAINETVHATHPCTGYPNMSAAWNAWAPVAPVISEDAWEDHCKHNYWSNMWCAAEKIANASCGIIEIETAFEYVKYLTIHCTYRGFEAQEELYQRLESRGHVVTRPTIEDERNNIDGYCDGEPFTLKPLSYLYRWKQFHYKFPAKKYVYMRDELGIRIIGARGNWTKVTDLAKKKGWMK